MEFIQFTLEKYNATLEKWKEEAESTDSFPHEVEQRLAWIEESIANADAPGNHKTMAYGVFQPDADIAVCTCELVLSDRGQLAGKWLKLLKVTLSPEIDWGIQQVDVQAIKAAIQAYKTATLGSFAARLNHDAGTLKVYGRNEDQLKFLVTVIGELQSMEDSPVEASKEGRWLVLKTNKG